jgi:hypothetical protein
MASEGRLAAGRLFLVGAEADPTLKGLYSDFNFY